MICLSASASCLRSEGRHQGQSPDERLNARAEQAVPMLAELKIAFEATLNKISGKSTLAQALRYALSRWPSLTRYTTDGRLEISNNAAERAIRPLAMGRKNWLFAGSDTGGERAAIIYTTYRNRQNERPRPRSLSPRHHRPHRRPSHQKDRRTPAMERPSIKYHAAITGRLQSKLCRRRMPGVD